ncbi:hypothetical protein BDP55DRAFT_55737 [Colletotrichum godetiae]|uniref:Uncharacterized protein n=1 Tax=Colletotrichum godetiae TaxID=1209918 RepID=A0AAJ0A5J5_9PEZI|nr:uncharacterized protein BDP55DRAFT_55737 [Colletotrichum godetiae]KAK1656901.1 hypothetical protein BDP55DRAFT_55737 [Colletotrichum godetiae]
MPGMVMRRQLTKRLILANRCKCNPLTGCKHAHANATTSFYQGVALALVCWLIYNQPIAFVLLYSALSCERHRDSGQALHRYRHRYRGGSQSSNHILRLEDGIQLAGHVAFLPQRSEGFAEIAAVCIEEQPNHQGLIIRLARNELQRTEEVESIRGLLRVLEDCASEGMLAVLREVRQ